MITNQMNIAQRRSRQFRRRVSHFPRIKFRGLRSELLEDRNLLAVLMLSDATDSLAYAATSGIANDVTVSFEANSYSIVDSAENILIQGNLSGCSIAGNGTKAITLACANQSDLDDFRFDLGDQDDSMVVNSIRGGEVNFDINAGLESDLVRINVDLSTAGADIDGGSGTDRLEIQRTSSTITVVLTDSNADGFDSTSVSTLASFKGINDLVGASSGTLTGRDLPSIWNLDGSPTYETGGQQLSFSGFATLRGGSEVDQFRVTAESTFNLSGGGNDDTFTIDAALTGTIDGEANNDTLLGTLIDDVVLTNSDANGFDGTEATIGNGFINIDSLIGNRGTLTGQNTPSTWELGANSVYRTGANSLGLSGFSSIQGGTNIDQFIVSVPSAMGLNGGDADDVFVVNATLTGTIDGQTGNDLLQGDQIENVIVSRSDSDGFDGTENSVTGGFSNMESLIGRGGLFTGLNSSAVWNLSNSPTYTSNGNLLNISGFATYQGGTNEDQFNVIVATVANLNGGGGSDTFDMGAMLTGTVNGQTGNDILTGDQIVEGMLTNSNANGFDGTAANVSGGFQDMESLAANAGTLTGLNLASTWELDNTATYSTSGFILNISGFVTLQGGSDIDQFTFTDSIAVELRGGGGNDVFRMDVPLSGSIDGQGGSDSLTGLVIDNVNLVDSNANGFDGVEPDVSGGFTDIEAVVGNSGTLMGQDVVSTWVLNETPSYTVNGNRLSINGFASLQGGTDVDLFSIIVSSTLMLLAGPGDDHFDIDATLTGKLDGESGNDRLEGNVINQVVLTSSGVNGFDGTESEVSGGFRAIDSITGSEGLLTGQDASSTWNLGPQPTYTTGGNTLLFSGFTTVQGLSDVDQFNVIAPSSFNLAGGQGNDVFDISTTLTGQIDGQLGIDTLQGSAIDDAVITNADANGLDGSEPSISDGFRDVEMLSGNGGTFTGQDNSAVWEIDDTPTYTVDNNTFNVGGYTVLRGGAGVDQFKVKSPSALDLLGSGGDDVFEIDAPLTGGIDGGAGSDTLRGLAIETVTLTGSDESGFTGTEPDISGVFSGIDTLVGNGGSLSGQNSASAWDLDGTPTYTSDSRSLSFSGFMELQGGTNVDQFNVVTASEFNLDGGNGSDIFTVNATLTGSINGEGGSDTVRGGTINEAVTAASDADGFDLTEPSVTGRLNNIERIFGNGGTLTGQNVLSTWRLGTETTYTVGANALVVGGFALLQGGSAVDNFSVTTPSSFNLRGGAGDDTFDLDAGLTGTIDGQANRDLLSGNIIDDVLLTNSDAAGFDGTEPSFGGFADIETVVGTGGRLTGQRLASSWELDATPTYATGGNVLGIGGFMTLQGSSAIDQFRVSADSAFNLNGGEGPDVFDIDAALTGAVNGQGQVDTLQGDQINDVTLVASDVEGFDGMEPSMTGGFNGMDTLIGIAGTLVGQNATSRWDLNGSPTYNTGTNVLNFAGFNRLQGSAGTDTFHLTSTGRFDLFGGSGEDAFAIDAILNGTVEGGPGDDALRGTLIEDVLLSQSDANGFDGIETSIVNGFKDVETIIGTGGKLTGQNASSLWRLDGTPSYTTGGNDLNFGGFATLQGSDDVDQFAVTTTSEYDLSGGLGNDRFQIDAILNGVIRGETGSDTLEGEQIDNLTLTNSDNTGFDGVGLSIRGGFVELETLMGNGGTLTGQNLASTWDLDGTPTYRVGANSLNIGGFATLQGSTDIDLFNVTQASQFDLAGGTGSDRFNIRAILEGMVHGELGTDDELNLSAIAAASATLTGSSANGFSGARVTNVTGGFDGIDTLIGNATGGTLTGQDVSSTWMLDGTPAYDNSNHVLNYAGFLNYQGGSSIDSFIVSAETIGNLLGGVGNDKFTVEKNLEGAVDGQSGDSDELDISTAIGASATLVDSDVDGFSGSQVTNVEQGFRRINILTGNRTSGVLTGQNATSTWNLGASELYIAYGDGLRFNGFLTLQGGSQADEFAISSTVARDLMGGQGNDSFSITDSGDLEGIADGQAEDDLLDLSAVPTTRVIDLSSTGTVDGFDGNDDPSVTDILQGFRNINNIRAGQATNDQLMGLDTHSEWTIDDTAGDDYTSTGRRLLHNSFETSMGGSQIDNFNVFRTVQGMPSRTLQGGASNDVFNLRSPVTETLDLIQQMIMIDGGTEGPETRQVRTGAGQLTPPSPLGQNTKFVEASAAQLPSGDTINLLDGSSAANGNGGAFQLTLNGHVARGPSLDALAPLLDFRNVRLVNLEGGLGNELVVVDLPAVGFKGAPLIVTVDGNPQNAVTANSASLKINGSDSDDFIVLEEGIDNGNRAPFELDHVSFVHVVGLKGNDVIISDLTRPALLEGGDGSDVLLGGKNVDLLFGGDGTDAIFGNDGNDSLFADFEIISSNRLPAPPDPTEANFCVNAPSGSPTTRVCVRTVTAPNDLVNGGKGSDNALTESKPGEEPDQTADLGGSIVGEGTRLSVIDWLTARFVVNGGELLSKAFDDFVIAGGGLDWSTRPVVQENNSTTLSYHNSLNHLDVDSDGSVAPIDALYIVNDINSSGSRKLAVPTALATLQSRHLYFDTDGDSFISPMDALLVINFINRQSRSIPAAVPDFASAATQNRVREVHADFYRPGLRRGAVADNARVESVSNPIPAEPAGKAISPQRRRVVDVVETVFRSYQNWSRLESSEETDLESDGARL